MKKYQIIYADTPWKQTLEGGQKSARGFGSQHYGEMSFEELSSLNIPADDNCILFLWSVFPEIQQALDLIKAWGFKYKTVGFTWVKQNTKSNSLFWGMGYYTRANAEVCLIAIKGRPKPIIHNIHSVIISKREKHSKKPDEVRNRIVQLMGDIPRIELFARKPKDLFNESYEGWDVWGNEVESDVELKIN